MNFPQYKITDAITMTIIGIADIANANATKEGRQNFVSNQIAIKERTFPITGNTVDNATF